MPDADAVLSVRNLQVDFGSFQALKGVSFDIGRERVGIVGESGSGKSTAGRAVMRLLPASATVRADRLSFNGVNLLSASEKTMRGMRGSDMALIMQDPRYSLNPVLTVAKQMREAARVHLGLRGAAADEKVREMLHKVRITDADRVMKLYPHQISGGMGQRVMIAMMLLAKPKLVIADEPTSALDVSVRQDVLNLLDTLVRENGSSLILISHDIRMVAAFCQRILIMYRGHLVESVTNLEEATHPYTRALIDALPDPRRPDKYLKVIDRNLMQSIEETLS